MTLQKLVEVLLGLTPGDAEHVVLAAASPADEARTEVLDQFSQAVGECR